MRAAAEAVARKQVHEQYREARERIQDGSNAVLDLLMEALEEIEVLKDRVSMLETYGSKGVSE